LGEHSADVLAVTGRGRFLSSKGVIWQDGLTEGSIEAGKLADLMVVSQDFFPIEPSEIGKTAVLLTMANGKVVYQSRDRNAAWSSAEAKSRE
jgi:phosphoribosyl-AMP cyclohydrolase